MKRTVILAAAVLAACLVGSGCNDDLKNCKASLADCEKNQVDLRSQLRVTKDQLKDLENERALWAASQDTVAKGLLGQLDKIREAYRTLELRYNELKAAADKAAPVVNIAGPLEPAVDKALQDLAAKYPGKMEYDAQKGVVRFSSDLLFASGSYQLNPEVLKQLADFADVVNIPEAGKYDVLVVGHTDNQPVSNPATKARTPTNWHLSVFRAVAVVEALLKDKVDPKRASAMGFGEERPRVPNNKTGGTKENRRVEVYLVPKTGLGAPASPVPAGGAD